MGRAQELLDELVEEAPQGALNAATILVWILGAILAIAVLAVIGALLWIAFG